MMPECGVGGVLIRVKGAGDEDALAADTSLRQQPCEGGQRRHLILPSHFVPMSLMIAAINLD
jgi:hypothetical protein